MRIFLTAIATLVLVFNAFGQTTNDAAGKVNWISFPQDQFEVNGLPWFDQNAPELWRLPKTAQTSVPKGVWSRAVAPDGGRIRFISDTTQLRLRAKIVGKSSKACFVDAFVDDTYAGSAKLSATNASDLLVFHQAATNAKQITLYLPNNHEIGVSAIGLDSKAHIKKPKAFATKGLLVCYGSSVLQGTGAAHPSKTYPATLARLLGIDFVNLGFGGAGKAEPEVVKLVDELNASCFLFDLGKSYGDQSSEPYENMIATIRAHHPTTPIVCVTPIYSLKEASEPEYRDRSVNLRKLMRQAAAQLQRKGDTNVFIVEGLDLFGEEEKNLFSDPLHPNDEGNSVIAQRLAPLLTNVMKLESRKTDLNDAITQP